MDLIWRLRIPFAAGLIAALLIELAVSSIRIHYRELEILLQRNAYLENGEGQMHLAAKFITQLKLYRNEISRAQADEQEFDINDALRQKLKPRRELNLGNNAIDRMNIFLINGMRFILSQSPLPYEKDEPMFEELAAAFNLERMKEYRSAMAVYDKVLQEYPKSDLRLQSLVELHQGFCFAILGNHTSAKEKLNSVIQAQSNSDLGVTSSILLEYLNMMENEKNLVAGSQMERARKYTDLLHCDEALQLLGQMSSTIPMEIAEINLLKGRCQEEIGGKSAAVHSYLTAIQQGKTSAVSRDANRRIFIVGTQTENRTKIQDAAIHINAELKDSALARIQTKQAEQAPVKHDTLATAGISTNEEAQIALQAQSIAESLIPPGSQGKPTVEDAHQLLGLPKVGTHAIINMFGGKTISGEILSQPTENVVRVKTMIGVIGIARKDIRSIETD